MYAKQDWSTLRALGDAQQLYGRAMYENKEFKISVCNSCGEPTIWCCTTMVYPLHSTAELPSPDLPQDVLVDFEEARLIANLSPRGAAALLRLGIQKLCLFFGEDGKNINADIASLVQKGLPVMVQEALDSVRVIGNAAVHPGTLDIKDDQATVNSLFQLVNFIARKMITEPREIGEIYSSLPSDKLKAIEKRDAQS